MRKMLIASLLAVCVLPSALAQATPDANALRAANAVVGVMLEALVDRGRETLPPVKAQTLASPALVNMTPDQRQRVSDLVETFPDRLRNAVEQRLPPVDLSTLPPEVAAHIAAYVAQHPEAGRTAPLPEQALAAQIAQMFTPADLPAIADFLETPSGRAVIALLEAQTLRQALHPTLDGLSPADHDALTAFAATAPGHAFSTQLGTLFDDANQDMGASMGSQYATFMGGVSADLCTIVGHDGCVGFITSGGMGAN